MQFLRDAAKETIPVVLGVLLALFLNNWKENLASERYLEQYYVHINEEVNYNLDKLESSIVGQKKVLDSIAIYRESDFTVEEVLKKADGVQMPLIQNTSWRLLQNTKIGEVDFEVMSLLSYMERLEYFFDLSAENFIDVAQEFEYSNRPLAKQKVMNQLEELIDKEETFMKIFEEYKLWFEDHN